LQGRREQQKAGKMTGNDLSLPGTCLEREEPYFGTRVVTSNRLDRIEVKLA